VSILSFVLIVSGVLLNAMAQLWFRVGFEPHIMAGLMCYVLSVAIWIVALSKVPVSVAYPMLSIGYVVNAIAAWYLFGEYLSTQKLAGIAVIIVGVCLVAKS
jgi:multidrug transporter EmrE-like cation transporter